MRTPLEEAVSHHAARRWMEAEAGYRAILADTPHHAGARYRLGVLRLQRGDAQGAVAELEAALAASPPEARLPIHQALAAAYRRLQDRDAALAHYGAAARLEPDSAAAALNLAAALADVSRYDAAVEAFAEALRLDPSLVEARHGLAVTLNRLGRFTEAEAVSREGPASAALAKTLAVALKEQGRLDEAAARLEDVLRRAPGDLDALYNLGLVRKDQGRTEEALAAFRALLARAPDHAAARLALCMAELPPLYRDEAELERSRAAYAAALQALAGWADRAAPDALADAVGMSQPFYLAYQGGDDVALQRAYGRLVCRAMAARYPPAALAGPPAPGERLRVGFVSGFFRRHANWRIPVRGWVEGLDRTRFALFGYHTSPLRDAETAAIAERFDHFVQGPLSTEDWRSRIAEDRPHVLIYPEVGMDPMAARLAAQRLAPLQCNGWGHPVTSGFPTLDLFLSSDDMEPPGAEAAYTERLVRLPGLSSAVQPLRPPPPAERAALGLRPGARVFWCGQSLYKYRPRHDEVFARIAERVGDCQFVFVAFPGSDALTERFRRRLDRAFGARGVEGARRRVILPRLTPEGFLAALGACDVVLDSLGWSGCNSLIDALSCGRPVVTLEGDSLRARHGAALLRRAGLGGYVCATLDAYVELAARLAEGGGGSPHPDAVARLERADAEDGATAALARTLRDAFP